MKRSVSERVFVRVQQFFLSYMLAWPSEGPTAITTGKSSKLHTSATYVIIMQLRVRFSDAKTTSTANSCLRLPMRCATTSTQLAIDCDVQRLLRLPMRCATTAIVKINACSRFICVRRRELRLHVYEDKVEIRFQSPGRRANERVR